MGGCAKRGFWEVRRESRRGKWVGRVVMGAQVSRALEERSRVWRWGNMRGGGVEVVVRWTVDMRFERRERVFKCGRSVMGVRLAKELRALEERVRFVRAGRRRGDVMDVRLLDEAERVVRLGKEVVRVTIWEGC